MKTLVLTSQIIDERNYQRFYMEQLADQTDEMILDLTKILHKKVFEAQYKKRKTGLSVTYIDQDADLYSCLSDLGEFDYIISFLGNVYEGNHHVYDLLRPYQGKLCVMALSGFPSHGINIKTSRSQQLITKIRRESSILGVFKKIGYFLAKSRKRSPPVFARYLVSCGAGVTGQYSGFIGENTEVVESCSHDYIKSLENYDRPYKDKYVVFLDENLISHSDYMINGVTVENEKDYYSELAAIFSYIEKNFSVRVVVAAHPRSELVYTQEKLPGHDIFLGNTNALVKYSEACITHASTSANFAVIFKKPILFITSDRMKKTRPANELLASWFDRTPVNMSRDDDYHRLKSHWSLNEKLYEKYMKNFISYSSDCEYGYNFILKR